MVYYWNLKCQLDPSILGCVVRDFELRVLNDRGVGDQAHA